MFSGDPRSITGFGLEDGSRVMLPRLETVFNVCISAYPA